MYFYQGPLDIKRKNPRNPRLKKMLKVYQFTLTLENKTIETFAYGDSEEDVISRFPDGELTDIKEIDDPLKDAFTIDVHGKKIHRK